MLNHDLLFSVLCCFLLDRLNKETTCNVMVDHLQSHVTPWRQYTSHVTVRGTLSKMDVLFAAFAGSPISIILSHDEFELNTEPGSGPGS